MKPLQKVVTAQDVQSSLYYLHVDGVNDYKLLQSEGSGDDQPEEEDSKTHTLLNPQTSIRRKPIAQSPNSAPSDRSGIPASSHILLQTRSQGPHGDAKVARKPVNETVGSGHRSFEAPPVLPPRKLVGPRAMNQRLHSMDIAALQNVPERQNIDMRRWSEQPGAPTPRLPPRMDSIRRKQMGDISLRGGGEFMEEQRMQAVNGLSAEHYWDWERTWEQKRAIEAREEMTRLTSEWQESQEHTRVSKETSLSLIRRYNGEQWNVGKIASIGTEHGVTGIRGAAISIEIMTQGYYKFMAPQGLIERSSLLTTPNKEPGGIGEKNNIFRRDFEIPGNPRKPSPDRSPASSESRRFEEEGRSSSEHRQPSHDSFRPSTTDLPGHKTTSSKGYLLQSPWNGLCEFTTGIAGRSLKCKHSYPSTKPTIRSGVFSAPVSELRFNLPSSKVLGTPAAKSQIPGTPREWKRSSRFLGSHHLRNSTSNGTHESHDQGYFGAKVELEDRLDLSLGHEHAGGGFGGKQAKLGKLIVEVEGLQMLDFVVAANMALWWQIYEKIT